MPDSDVAIIEEFVTTGALIDERRYFLDYLDGAKVSDVIIKAKKLLPGRHTVGLTVLWGDVCPPLPPFGISSCFNACYSGLVLKAEAGRSYGYDIEKNKDQVFVTISDKTGKVAAKGACEKCSWTLCGQDQKRSINDRVERESKNQEMENNSK